MVISAIARQRVAASAAAVCAIVAGWAVRPEGAGSASGDTSALLGAPPATTQPAAADTSPPMTTAPVTVTATSDAPLVVDLAPVDVAPPTTFAPASPPTLAPDIPVPIAARPIPPSQPEPAPPAPKPPWAWSTRTTSAGHVSTDVGCARGTDPASLDAFFAARVGPLIGADYPHVYPLGGDRYLWLMQDAFVDHGGGASRLGQATFIHNVALEQRGACFTLLHRGSDARPQSFESAIGESPTSWWFWPLGGELVGDRLFVFWAEMNSDGATPPPGDGLGWHPVRTWIASYDSVTLARQSFDPAPNEGANPLYGYAVASDDAWTYLFGNTFEQNLTREGGFWSGPHSATAMRLARVPRGALTSPPEYRTADGWSADPAAAAAIVQRFWTENPMQPRFLAGQWVSVAKVDGYWGEEMVVDVALDPWGPWTTIERRDLVARVADRKIINTYHAHLMPWLAGGELVISVSQNARDMARDAYPHPERYRSMFIGARMAPPPPPPPPPETTIATTVPETTTTTSPPTTPSTVPPTVATTVTTTQPTTVPPSTTSSITTTTTPPVTTRPPPSTSTTTTTVRPTTTAPASTTTTAAGTSTSVPVSPVP